MAAPRLVGAILAALLSPLGCSAERRFRQFASQLMTEDEGPQGAGSKPLRLAIVGLTGDGKSSLCNWLLGTKGAFKVSNKTDSETKDVKVAEGHLFGDATYPELVIADTPGLADTKGEDATLWQNAVQDLRTRFDGELDLVLWVVNGAGSRWSEQRQAMIEAQRFTFGYKYWKHMAVIFTHWPTKVSDDDPTGNSKEVAARKAREWQAKLVDSDASYFANGMAEEHIAIMPFYFVDLAEDLSTRFFSNYKGSWADAQKAIAWTFDKDGAMTYSKSGMADLTSFARAIMDKVASPTYEALDISDATPRMGPGEVDAHQVFECFFPGDRRCEVHLKGKYLGDMDEVRLLPASTKCGQAPQLEAQKVGLQFTQQRSRVDGGQTERFFDFGSLLGEHAVGTFEVCYCEAGHCADDRRFAQHAGQLKVMWSGCALPAYTAAAPVAMGVGALLPRHAMEKYTCSTGHTTSGELGARAEFTIDCDPSAEKRVDAWIRCETPPCHCLPVHCAVSATETAEPAVAKSQAVVPFGTEVRYNCRPGFTTDAAGAVVPGASYSTSCLADGSTGPEQCVRVKCGKAPTRIHASSDMEGKVAIFGQTVTFTCATGYSTDGNPASSQNNVFKVSCGTGGTFEPASPAQACIPVSCGSVGELAAIPGAAPAKPTEVVTFPDEAKYTCERGHAAKGAGGKLTTAVTRRCQADGTFEPSAGCQPMECSFAKSELPPKAILDGPMTVKFDEIFEFRCKEGNTTSGQPGGGAGFSIMCDPSVEKPRAEWVRCKTPPCQCQTVHCAVPSTEASVPALAWQDGVAFGTKVQYNCRPGFTSDKGGVFVKDAGYTTSCLADGTVGPEKCFRVSCGAVPSRTNAHSELQGQVVKFGQSATFTCAAGYSTDGSPALASAGNDHFQISCGTAGTFEAATAAQECIPVSCGSVEKLAALPGAKPTTPKEVVVFPNLVAYECDVGFAARGQDGKLTSAFSRRCQADGTFEQSEGCRQMECSFTKADMPPQALLKGPAKVTHGERFNFGCKEGNTTSGQPGGTVEFTILCDPSPEKPVEDWKRCETPPCQCSTVHCDVKATGESEPAEPKQKVVPFGTKVRYNCRPGFTTDNKAAFVAGAFFSTSCLADGTTGPEKCHRVTCGKVPSRTHASSATEGQVAMFEQTATFTCATGYSTDGAPVDASKKNGQFQISCGTGGTFEPASPGTECVPVKCGSVDQLPAIAGATPTKPKEVVVFPDLAVYECEVGQAHGQSGNLTTSITRRCQADGTFEPSEGCHHMECSFPEAERPARAKLLGEATVRYGHTFEFSCKEGNTTSGQPGGQTGFTIACDPSVKKPVSEWKRCETPPCQCLTVQCPLVALETATVASARAAKVPFGTEVRYDCRPGFTTDAKGAFIQAASYTTSCLADGTTGPERCVRVSCGQVPSRSHASSKMKGEALIFEQTATFTCATGYSTDGRPAGQQNIQYQIVCGTSGTFEAASAAKKCIPVSCGSVGQLEPVPGATASSPAEVVPFPQSAQYKCDFGHAAREEGGALTSTITRKCQADGSFEHSDGCQHMECTFEASRIAPRAKLLGASTVKFGEDFEFKCQEGNTTSGEPTGASGFTIACDPSVEKPVDEWTRCKTPPCECVTIQCAIATSVASSPVDKSKKSVPFGTKVSFKCNPGFVADKGGASYDAHCLADGTLGPEMCKRKSCGALPPRTNATSDKAGQELVFESKATYICESGFSTDGHATKGRGAKSSAPNDRFEVVCGTEGTFVPTGSANGCVPVQCGHVSQQPALPGAAPAKPTEVVAYPSAAAYHCNVGHAARGEMGLLSSMFERRCLADGTFEPSKGCEQLLCKYSQPHLPENAKLHGHMEVTHGDIFKFSCNEGHTTSGQPDGLAEFAIRCETSAEKQAEDWKQCEKPPCHCLAVQCPVSSGEASGPAPRPSKKGGVVPFGTKVTYNCHPGFTTDSKGAVVAGASYQTSCLADGTTGPERCVRVSCGAVPPRTHASSTMDGHAVTFGETVTFTCASGYSIDGLPAKDSNSQFQISCGTLGTFEPASSAQECVPVKCGSVQKLPAIPGASPSKPTEAVVFPNKAAYACQHGHAAQGADGKLVTTIVRGCQADGTFEPSDGCQPMKCTFKKADLPGNAKHPTSLTVGFDESFGFTCNEGHTTSGQPHDVAEFQFACDPSAEKPASEWIKCKSPACRCLAVQCAVSATDGAQPAASSKALVPFGTEVTFNCRPGFTTNSEGAVVPKAAYKTSCLADGTTGADQCRRVSCGNFPSRTHATTEAGSDMLGNIAVFGQTVTYQCAAGYSTDGKAASEVNSYYQMSCSATGSYEPASPAQECVPVSCGSVEKLPPVLGATPSKPTEVVTFPNAATYTCNVGQVGKDENGAFASTITRRCMPSGTFAPSDGCKPMECDISKEAVPPNAELAPSGSTVIKFGETAKYKCQDGFSLNGFAIGPPSNFEFGLACEAGELKGQLAKPAVKCEPVNIMPKDPAYVLTCDEGRSRIVDTESKKKDECHTPKIVCAAGYAGKAVVKTVSNARGTFTLSGCEPCPAGKFSEAPNQETCDACPKNMYQNKEAQSSCLACPAGLVTGTHKLAVNESDCVDVTSHRCCCTSDMKCALVAPSKQKAASGHVPTWYAKSGGGHCPLVDFQQYCATWGKYASQFPAVLGTSNKEGSCKAGEVPFITRKCHGVDDDKKSILSYVDEDDSAVPPPSS